MKDDNDRLRALGPDGLDPEEGLERYEEQIDELADPLEVDNEEPVDPSVLDRLEAAAALEEDRLRERATRDANRLAVAPQDAMPPEPSGESTFSPPAPPPPPTLRAPTRDVLLSDIVVPAGFVEPKAQQVAAMVDSMQASGQLEPILTNGKGRLIAGLTRLRAAQQLGWNTIVVRVFLGTPEQEELAGIDENLVRRKLSKLEEAEKSERQAALYEQLSPRVARRGGARPGAGRKPKKSKESTTPLISGAENKGSQETPPAQPSSQDPTPAEVVATKTGQHPKTVSSKLATVRNLSSEIRDLVRGTPVADSVHDLRELGKLPEDDQRGLAEIVNSGAATTLKLAKKKLAENRGWRQTDCAGQRIPQRLKLAFAELPNVMFPLERQARKFRTAVKKARKELAKTWEKADADSATRGSADDAALATLEGLADQLVNRASYGIPAAVCGYCGGSGCKVDGGQQCPTCRGCGWVTRALYEKARKASE